jgi:hypothetical protein
VHCTNRRQALRFLPAGSVQRNTQTLQFDSTQLHVFLLDEQKLQAEVREIEATEYFQRLRNHTRQLRRNRL